MAKFDYTNAKEYRVAFGIIVVIIVILIVYIKRRQCKEQVTNNGRTKSDGNGDAYYLGRGSSDDSISQLLDRIEWSTYLHHRTTYWHRAFIVSIIITALIIAFVMRKLPKPGVCILLFFIIFIPLYAVHNLHYVHGDVYNDYYIKNNVELLREKLGTEKHKPKNPREDNVPDRVVATSK